MIISFIYGAKELVFLHLLAGTFLMLRKHMSLICPLVFFPLCLVRFIFSCLCVCVGLVTGRGECGKSVDEVKGLVFSILWNREFP